MIGRLRVEAESAAQPVAFMRREEPVHALLTFVGGAVPAFRERMQHGIRERESIRRVVDALDVAQKLHPFPFSSRRTQFA